MLKYFLYFVIGILNFQLLYRTLKSYFLYAKKSFILGIFYFLLLYRTRKNPKIISYMLNNNFSYIQLSFFFSSSERFLFRSRWYWRFFSFSSSERFWYLSRASFRSFSLLFLIFIYHFYIYIYKKIYKSIFISFSI